MKELIDILAIRTRLPRADIELIIRSAPRRYKVYSIPKRSGGKRVIAHPARELKTIQRALIDCSPEQLQVHANATAYEVGTSILKNAQIHVGKPWLAKFDIKDFFNSITSQHWSDFLQSIMCPEEYLVISQQVFFWKPGRRNTTCLSVGAPSSPFASNRFMYSFDENISKYCQERDMKYSRYADDIAISADEKIDLKLLEKAVTSAFPFDEMFQLNKAKTLLAGPGQRRSVTGIILNNDGEVSLGRKRKRVVEAMVHSYSLGRAKKSAEEISGHLAFLKMVDPRGYDRIYKRFHKKIDLFKK